MTALRATVRLQLRREFDFAAATAQVPYFAALGLSHIYMSPIATARPGSTHGYDVIDPLTVNPELGGETGLAALVDALHAHAMGAILDIVPNHMAADLGNVWWADVLANGESSAYATYFDIEWDAPDTGGKLWLPWLEQPLQQALDHRRLTLERRVDGNAAGVALDGNVLPLSAGSLEWLCQRGGIALPPPDAGHTRFERIRHALQNAAAQHAFDRALREVDHDPALMHQLLEQQHYRLAWWRSGDQLLNYRRFFDIDGLAALRMERDEVFEAVHALPLRLIENGSIDGLRIDHIDGLSQPGHYLRRLRERMDQAAQHGPQRHVSLYVEKILAADESLPLDWPVDGSTGYDFMRQVESLQLDPGSYAVLCRAWARSTGRPADFAAEENAARRQLLRTSLVSELARCTRAFCRYFADTAAHGDITAQALHYALTDVLAGMPVYRSYLGDGHFTGIDRRVLQHAFAQAELDGEPHYAPIRALLQQPLLDADEHSLPPAQAEHLHLARQRFEQLSTVLAAKAVEDTAFYRYGPLLSRNEVGGAPGHKQPEPMSWHAAMRQRAIRWPRSLLATATHDHKRGEDVRARLQALGEKPREFADRVHAWSNELGERSRLPYGVLWMLLQTVLAAWPLELAEDDLPAMRQFADRITEWLRKAQREAKLHTRWTCPDTSYEAACAELVEDLLLSAPYVSLRRKLRHAAHELDAPGAMNGLVATALRLTVPGVPDLYQGTEYWDQSLVDPDNRHTPDYAARAASLEQAAEPVELLCDYRSGAVKQQLIYRLLQLRKAWPELFSHGAYLPVAVTGAQRKHVVAFVRQHGERRLLVVAPRLCARHMDGSGLPLPNVSFWKNTRARTVDDDAACTFIDLFTYKKHGLEPMGWNIAELLADWPLAVLIPASQADDCPTFPRRTPTQDQ
ncbi:malto-oligosyltrehalose synthase [Dyella acidiphila]|uniref:Malto-oligosyltrehalose synthase n=1 Tax=Dyella acidiphila TaxID=2775866 RepID=A0ABR9GCU6_9GAMM|nr:malto-oligosyltrehalose synthase [Dyella acidiphila]MBE1161814.1 malto-oligosyltrehalose synthase [Dyella acidiphila]